MRGASPTSANGGRAGGRRAFSSSIRIHEVSDAGDRGRRASPQQKALITETQTDSVLRGRISRLFYYVIVFFSDLQIGLLFVNRAIKT